MADEVNLFFHSSNDTTYDVLAMYNFRNTGESVVTVQMSDQQEIPFIKFPKGAESAGYEAVQDSAPFISLDNGFAMTPGEQPYGIVAFSTVNKQNEITFIQEFVLPVAVVRIFVPDGMEIKGEGLTAESPQDIQGTLYQAYVAKDFKAGTALTFELSGTRKGTSAGAANTTTSNNNLLLFGAGGAGILFIAAGVWMYLRDRKQAEKDLEDDEAENADSEDEFKTSEEVLDAMAEAVSMSKAKNILIPLTQEKVTLVGTTADPLPHLVEEAVKLVKEMVEHV